MPDPRDLAAFKGALAALSNATVHLWRSLDRAEPGPALTAVLVEAEADLWAWTGRVQALYSLAQAMRKDDLRQTTPLPAGPANGQAARVEGKMPSPGEGL